MKGLALGLSVYAAAVITSVARADEWQFVEHGNTDSPACELQISGEIREATGADVDMNCHGEISTLASLQLILPARAFQQRRVSLVADVNSDDTLQATVSLKSLQDRQTLMLEDDSEQMLVGDSGEKWQSRTLVLPVDVRASQLRVAVLVQGRGHLSLRNVRLSISEQGSMSDMASGYLDDVMALLKQTTSDRLDLHWRVLEPQLRVLASGAQTTEDVYPAIRYALAAIGDHRNMLLTPQVVHGLGIEARNASRDTESNRRWSLSDGAQLVLAPLPPVRTAHNAAFALSSQAMP